MDAEFVSKPHAIRAFKISIPFKNKPAPEWLLTAYKQGKASVTCGQKGNYITLYENSNIVRGYPGQWLCINEQEKLFFLTEEEIEKGFRRNG